MSFLLSLIGPLKRLDLPPDSIGSELSPLAPATCAQGTFRNRPEPTPTSSEPSAERSLCHMRWNCLVLCCAAAVALSCSVASSSAGVSIFTLHQRDDRVEILLDGQPWSAFLFHSKWDKPFLYPVRTASGNVLSRGWPVEPRPGDEQDHAWHRGIWYGHGDINGEDFWREKPDGTTARLVMQGGPKLTDGKRGKRGSLEAVLAMRGAKGTRIGTVTERLEFERLGSSVMIHATVTVSADGGGPLRFGDTDDGGFGFRLATEFRQDRGAELMNSDGLTGTQQIWGKQAKWVKYSATINGKRAGVAMVDHPSNLRHPTGWHARGYSLCSANPFAVGSFAGDKRRDGSYVLPEGQTLKLRYLVVVFDGDLPTGAMHTISARFAKE